MRDTRYNLRKRDDSIMTDVASERLQFANLVVIRGACTVGVVVFNIIIAVKVHVSKFRQRQSKAPNSDVDGHGTKTNDEKGHKSLSGQNHNNFVCDHIKVMDPNESPHANYKHSRNESAGDDDNGGKKDVGPVSIDWQRYDVDAMLHFLGRFGRYQVTQILLLFILATNMPHPILSGMFTGKHVEVTCDNMTRAISTTPPDTAEIMTSLYPDHWGLMCEQEHLEQLPQIMSMVGMGFGAMCLPHLGDRYGRRTLLVVTCLCQFLVMLLQAFAEDFELFVFLKFLGGSLQQAQMVPLYTALLEVLPREMRSLIGLLQTLMWVIGLCIVGLVGWIFREYPRRQLHLAYALSLLPAMLTVCFLDESLRWLVVNSKTKQVESILRRACKANKKSFGQLVGTLEKSRCETKDEAELLPHPEDKEDSGVKVDLSVVTNKNLRRVTLVMCYAWFICSLSYFGLTLLSTSLDGDPYVNFILSSLVEIPSGFFIYYAMQRYGRKRTVIFCEFVASLSLFLAALIATVAVSSGPFPIFKMCLTLIGKCFMSGAFSVLWIYTPELYPTNLRNIGIGLSSAAARAGASLSPFFTLLARKASWAPGSMFAFCSLISVFLLMLIPETRWEGLPRNVQDIDAWFEKKKTGPKLSFELTTNVEPKKKRRLNPN